MLRFCKTGYLAIRNVSTTGFGNFGNRVYLPKLGRRTILQRFYSDKCDKGKKGVQVKFISNPRKVPLHKILDPSNPSQGTAECNKQNLIDQVPCPNQSWNSASTTVNSKNRKILAIGVIIFLTSAYVIYQIVDFDKKGNAKKEKKIILKDPLSSSNIPNQIPYLLIGGGTASFAAFRAIKSTDPLAKVLVIANEFQHPYMRPPLSKEIWFNEDEESISKLHFKQWNGSERSLLYEPPEFYTKFSDIQNSEKGGVAVARGWKVQGLDVINKKATLEDGYVIEYDKCLIATGSVPRSLTIFSKSPENIREKVSTYRNINDFQKLREICKNVKSIVVIGGGFLGSELACSLGNFSKKFGGATITQVFKEQGNLGKVLPEYLSKWTTNKVEEEGVNVLTETTVIDVDLNDNNQLVLKLNNGEKLVADHVIQAVGVEANTELAENSGLEIDPDLGGYLVNSELQARSNLYIAGDCTCFYDVRLGRRRVEHHDHAVVTGRLAGENMTGAAKPYLHQSTFWSDLGPDVGFEAIGIVSNELPTVGVFAKCVENDAPKSSESENSDTEQIKKTEECAPVEDFNKSKTEGENYGKGVIFYLRNDIIVGILQWNVFNRMHIARQILKEERKYENLNEVAKLFNIHED